MGLLPRIRPRVALLAHPLELVAGERVELRVRIDAPRPRRIEHADLWVRQLVRSSRGTGTRFQLHAPLSGPRTLPEGRTELASVARIPAFALPDHRGRAVAVSTLVNVSLASRWRLDVNRSFQLRSLGAPSEKVAEPLLFSSRAPATEAPYLEGSLDRSVLRPGGMLSGRVAALGADCSSLEVHLVASEQDHRSVQQAGRWRLRVNRPLADGQAVPFAMSIPADVTPTFRVGDVALSWAVELRAERSFARDLTLRIPVTVALGSGAPEPMADAPRVGEERVRALWERMAQHTGTTFEGGALHDRRGEVALTVRPGDEVLEAQLRYPFLGIGLEGGERSGLRRFLGQGRIEGFGDWWNQHFYATAREPERGAAFLLRALGRLVAVRFRAADDEVLTLAVDAPRDDGAALEKLVRLARRVADRIPEAARAIPMPAGLDRKLWEEAARSLEAELWPGPPRLEAEDGGWVLAICWPDEGAPFTRLSARSTAPIDERLQGDSAAGLPEALPRDARPLAEALAREGRLRIGAEALVLEIAGLTEAPAALEPTLDRLLRLLRLLRVDEGPYR